MSVLTIVTPQLTADQATCLEEIEQAVNAALLEPTVGDLQATERAISATGQSYTASVLAALAAWTRIDCDDEVGAAMLERFAREFARHEATVI